ncbi:hypothetical protein ACFCWG_29075 [Streptomyces sp. NPDC056390]|uniref:hypothetical protein n=1 Tax=Streptomyces sp. NPDC056390 TaxID=3345806 RepID=UPI0035D74874
MTARWRAFRQARMAGALGAPAAYDGEDATCALSAGEPAQGDGRRLSAPDEVGEDGGGVPLLDEAEVEQEVGGLEPYVGFEAGIGTRRCAGCRSDR